MKHLLSFTVIAVMIASCGAPDKAAELQQLKKQQSEISARIQELEKELGAGTTAQGKITDVIITPIAPTYFAHYIDVQGSVDADEAVDIRPLVAGTVTRILVNEGDVVREGQVLAETENEIYVRQLNSVKPQLDLARELYERQQRLWDQKVGSEVQLLQARTQKEYLEKQVETLEEQIDMTRIKSPINGTVDKVSIKIGQLAAASLVEPAFRVVNLSSLNVTARVAESNAGKIRQGNVVKLYFPDLGKEVDSKITFTSRTIDPMTRTFEAQASLGNDPAYRPNMVAVLRIADHENPNAITVPVNLLQNVDGHSHIFVATTEPDGRQVARRRDVQVGMIYGSTAEILSGLQEGDQLITTGYTDLTDGAQIRF